MKKFVRFILIILFCGLCFFAFLAFNSLMDNGDIKPDIVVKDSEKEEDIKPKGPVITNASLFMVGDCLIHSAVYGDADRDNDGVYDFTSMISEFGDIVGSHDLAFYNQESILGGTEIGLSTYPRFNSPYSVGDAFRNLGFNMVSLANNHTLDRGEQAIVNSKNYWNQFKDSVITAGSYQSQEERDEIVIKEVNGIKYTLLSYTTDTNGLRAPKGKEYFVNTYDNEKAKNDIEKIKDKVDVIIVAMHWGEEYNQGITNSQREIAEYLSSLGVNIIIGHHPHVVEPIDYIGNTLVVYSLGNFISAQRGVEKLTGGMVSLNIKKTVENDVTSISLENVKVGLTYTYSDMSKSYRTDFKVYPYQKLNDNILKNYQSYYDKYMNIMLKYQPDTERWW